jgi:biopolymer transport protein ExbB/TolQ
MNALVTTLLSSTVPRVQVAREAVVVADPAERPLGEIFSDGGFMMYPITLCAIATLAIAGRAAWRMRAGSTQPLRAIRAGIDGVLFWGVYASVLGVLGTVVGITLAAQAVEAVGEVHVALVSGGIKVALSTTIYGFLILLVAALLWFGLRQWHHREVLTEA